MRSPVHDARTINAAPPASANLRDSGSAVISAARRCCNGMSTTDVRHDERPAIPPMRHGRGRANTARPTGR